MRGPRQQPLCLNQFDICGERRKTQLGRVALWSSDFVDKVRAPDHPADIDDLPYVPAIRHRQKSDLSEGKPQADAHCLSVGLFAGPQIEENRSPLITINTGQHLEFGRVADRVEEIATEGEISANGPPRVS